MIYYLISVSKQNINKPGAVTVGKLHIISRLEGHDVKQRDWTLVNHFVAVFSHVIRINRMCCSCWNPEIKQNIYIILTAYTDKTPYEIMCYLLNSSLCTDASRNFVVKMECHKSRNEIFSIYLKHKKNRLTCDAYNYSICILLQKLGNIMEFWMLLQYAQRRI
jgi:hypothetical protein